MPYEIVRDVKACSVSKPYAVKKQGTDDVVGCHPSMTDAKKQMAALYAKEPGMTRTDELLPVRQVERYLRIEDLHIRSDGSGRVVEAYAAAFDKQVPINDQDGQYVEVLARTSFDKTINDKAPHGFGVLFNHGRTVDGTPSDWFSMPIGVPLEVRADERGVFTVTEYLDNPVAEYALDAIKKRGIKAQSFSGRFLKSTRSRPSGYAKGSLPLITRHEIDMREYGPAVFAAYKDAEILGVRAEQFVRQLLETPPDKRLSWLEQFEGLTTLLEPEALVDGTPDGAAEIVTDEPGDHSARSIPLRTRIRAARIVRGI
jgi:HK97 family phage prohead protease